MLADLARAVVQGWRDQPPCPGHHWHVNRRGWGCCQCPHRHRRADAPVNQGRCGQPTGPFDELQLWLSDLTPPDPLPLIRLRRRKRRVPR